MPLIPQLPIIDGRVLQHLQRRFDADFFFQKRTDTPDTGGGSSRAWTDIIEALGALQTLSPTERLGLGGVVSDVTHWAFVAYRTDLDLTMRIRYGTRIFDIHDFTDMGEQHIILQIGAVERIRKLGSGSG